MTRVDCARLGVSRLFDAALGWIRQPTRRHWRVGYPSVDGASGAGVGSDSERLRNMLRNQLTNELLDQVMYM